MLGLHGTTRYFQFTSYARIAPDTEKHVQVYKALGEITAYTVLKIQHVCTCHEERWYHVSVS